MLRPSLCGKRNGGCSQWSTQSKIRDGKKWGCCPDRVQPQGCVFSSECTSCSQTSFFTHHPSIPVLTSGHSSSSQERRTHPSSSRNDPTGEEIQLDRGEVKASEEREQQWLAARARARMRDCRSFTAYRQAYGCPLEAEAKSMTTASRHHTPLTQSHGVHHRLWHH